MSHRDLNSLVDQLAMFMTGDPACIQAAQKLSKDAEIGICIADYTDCTFFNQSGSAGFEKRKAKNPDVVFLMSAVAVDVLSATTERSIGDLGIEVLKQYLAGEVKIKVPGSLLSIMKNGYIGIIKDAGMPFAKFLAQHGVTSLSKIPDIIKKLRS